jgi:ABC-type polysaccharide/polyol phosphate export permease
VVCPPEIFPAVTVAAHTVHHLLALPVLLAALAGAALLGLHPFPWTVVLLPLALLPWLLLASGLALAVSVLGVLFRDVRDLVANLLTILFFGSPIIYTLHGLESTTLRSVLRLNPLAVEVEVYRALAFEGRVPSPLEWAVAVAVAVAAWAVGAAVFSRLRDTVAETL